MPLFRLAPLLCIAFFLIGDSSVAQEELLKHAPKNTRDTFVRIESIFGNAARQGAAPFRISIRNNTGRDRVWTVDFREGNSGRRLSTDSTFQFAVPNGSEVRHEVAVRFAPAFAAYDYRNLTVAISTPGLDSTIRNFSESTNRDFPKLAMSKSLARRSLNKLSDELKKENSSNQSFGKDVEIGALPSNWLGYTCLDALLLTTQDWNQVSQAQRQAILAWVRIGGRLDLYSSDPAVYSDQQTALNGLGIPVTNSGNITRPNLSLGLVTVQRWDGTELSSQVIGTYRNVPTRDHFLESAFGKSWGLYESSNTLSFNPILIFALLTIFAVLVAPVNLFYFAGKGKRHRLFITTPIISVAACILIVLLILFKDGLGGHGERVVLADFQPAPGEMRVYINQEQFSSTGVMISPGFKSAEELDINPVELPPSPFNPLSNRSGRTTTYLFSGNEFGGRFFGSRSEQAFAIRSAVPTRARVELIKPASDGQAPELVSNLPISIRNLYYVDTEGEVWATPENLEAAPGNTIPLVKPMGDEAKAWLDLHSKGFSKPQKKRILELLQQRNRFFCLPAGKTDFPLETHRSIRWDTKTVLMTGTVIDSKTQLDSNESASVPQ